MDFAEKHAMARGGSSIRLDVYRGNPGSVAFYQNRGYQMVGEFVIPWRSQPFCCMEKPLVQA
jgi:ribosomal protein S18 acetylase RimI-like enzyme